LGEKRADFKDIKSFEEFNNYYWYREELSRICKSLGLEYRGTKQELNHVIEQYFAGKRVEGCKMSSKQIKNNQDGIITLGTPLLECGFSLNSKFGEYFSRLTGVSPLKFTADMAAASAASERASL